MIPIEIRYNGDIMDLYARWWFRAGAYAPRLPDFFGDSPLSVILDFGPVGLYLGRLLRTRILHKSQTESSIAERLPRHLAVCDNEEDRTALLRVATRKKGS